MDLGSEQTLKKHKVFTYNTGTTVGNRHGEHIEIWLQRTEERNVYIVGRVRGNENQWGILLLNQWQRRQWS